jgi:hypothetical protein
VSRDSSDIFADLASRNGILCCLGASRLLSKLSVEKYSAASVLEEGTSAGPKDLLKSNIIVMSSIFAQVVIPRVL